MIYENDDDLGYSTDPDGPPRWGVFAGDTLSACNCIIPLGIQHAIEQAAVNAHRGATVFVTAWRKQASYSGQAGGYMPLGPLTYPGA